MKYRVKQKDVEAIIWTGKNIKEMKAFIGDESIAHIGITNDELIIITPERFYYKATDGFMIFKGEDGYLHQCDPVFFNTIFGKKRAVNIKMFFEDKKRKVYQKKTKTTK